MFDFGANETRFAVKPIKYGNFYGKECRDSRPDLDNLVKQIMEALQDSGLVEDDAQVAVIKVRKVK